MEAQELATISLLISERLIAEVSVLQDNADRYLIERHAEIRKRLEAVASGYPRSMRDQLFSSLEAVFLHAAQVFTRKN